MCVRVRAGERRGWLGVVTGQHVISRAKIPHHGRSMKGSFGFHCRPSASGTQKNASLPTRGRRYARACLSAIA